MVDFTAKTVWNMDEAVLKTIHELKTAFLIQIQHWQLENAYWTVRNIRMEVDAKLKDKEQKEANGKIKELEETRKKYLMDKRNKRGEFYNCLEEFYILLNRYMKSHGLFFREGDDPRQAVLQR